MIFQKIIFIAILVLPIYAAGTDDEIIKNLDFFQNMELLKDDNPYVTQLKTQKEEQSPANSFDEEKIK